MIYIFYNPLSCKGRGKVRAEKLFCKLRERSRPVKMYSVIGIESKLQRLIGGMSADDSIIVVGGDGTIHRLLNMMKKYRLPCGLYMYTGGSGNDFARDHSGKMFEITDEIEKLPLVTINGGESVFVNGVGMGVDANVCDEVNKTGKRASYLVTAIRCFWSFQPFSADIYCDGVMCHYDDIWFFAAMHGRFFGGGMKLAPRARRDGKKLDMVVVHGIKRWKILLILPTVFLGLHVYFKKYVTMIDAKKIEVKNIGYDVLQKDGEVEKGVRSLVVRARESLVY